MHTIALTSCHPVWQDFEQTRQRCLDWFTQQALPLWTTAGVDMRNGGFFEKLDAAGAGAEAPRRTRVVSRQLYVLCVAKKLGWTQDAAPFVAHGLGFLLDRLRQPDGVFASAVLPDGKVVDARFDLYEQAFALFALACVLEHDASRYASLTQVATDLVAQLRARWKHPTAGFEEASPRQLPLRSNPHMHLLEATLQWEATAGNDVGAWRQLSDEIAQLALTRLIDCQSGLVTELFDGDWGPAPGADGTLAEPGHQFEWGWLLTRWALSRGDSLAIEAARKMVLLAEQHGVDEGRGVAINSFGTDLQPRDQDAKLWPQTERVKAWALLSCLAIDEQEAADRLAHCTAALNGMMKYLNHPTAGAWQEVWRADGTWSKEDVRASSLYHVVCALETIHGLSAQEHHQ